MSDVVLMKRLGPGSPCSSLLMIRLPIDPEPTAGSLIDHTETSRIIFIIFIFRWNLLRETDGGRRERESEREYSNSKTISF